MFAAIYSFKVKPNQTESFEKAWEDLTRLIYQFEGSLGSRLHKSDALNYIAYAQWPDRNTWENSGKKLPDTANEIRRIMKEACDKIETVYTLDAVTDLLMDKTFSK